MPVPLPPAPTGGQPLPPQPNQPPTLQDVYAAIEYAKAIRTGNGTRVPGTATDDDVARAAIYEMGILIEAGGVGAPTPAWFGPAIELVLAPIKRTTAKCYNLQCHDGNGRPFEIVPFPNGTLPTGAIHNLPALLNVGAIRALSNADAARYVQQYGLGAMHVVADRKRAIGWEIGCTVVVV